MGLCTETMDKICLQSAESDTKNKCGCRELKADKKRQRKQNAASCRCGAGN